MGVSPSSGLVSPELLGLGQLHPEGSWDLPAMCLAPTILVGAGGTISSSSSVVSTEAGIPHPTEEGTACTSLCLGRRWLVWAGDESMAIQN